MRADNVAPKRTPFASVFENPNSLIANAGEDYVYRPPKTVKDIYTPKLGWAVILSVGAAPVGTR